ncbi:hypothetical protein [Halosimplex litoreum]|uniref:hypothetical protein n=1 Tax=Halosimplex litoreum TaxID=1198301 RepID=UPI001E4F60DA|nr:hypothetical protein [Halosimplex litoreum]
MPEAFDTGLDLLVEKPLADDRSGEVFGVTSAAGPLDRTPDERFRSEVPWRLHDVVGAVGFDTVDSERSDAPRPRSRPGDPGVTGPADVRRVPTGLRWLRDRPLPSVYSVSRAELPEVNK